MELSQIKYFIKTAQLENMSQASRVLGITQPTLSKSISNLEMELGTQLFDRSGKKLILNERGKRFLEGALLSLSELEGAVSSAQDEAIDSTLRLGLFCISEQFMECLGRFMQKNPDTLFHVGRLYGNPAQIDTNDFDALLYPGDTFFRKYRGQRAYTEKYSAAVNRRSPLSGRKSISAAELSDEKIIFISLAEKAFDLPYHLYHRPGVSRHGHMFTNDYELQRRMISFGGCAGFVPSGCRDSYIADENITLLEIEDDGFSQDIYIGFKREKHLSPNGSEFRRFVFEYFGME